MRKYILSLSLLIIAIICFFPTHSVFAAEEAGLATTAFSYLIKFASRGWMILAFLAGKLMSNDWVYASGLHLDKVLFTMWNYMKNIANFILGFLLIAGVLKSLFTKNAFNLKSELPKFLLASVLINMSWFLMGTLIDLSNVATAAVGAFPQALMGDSLIKDQQLNKLNASIPDKIEINGQSDVKTYKGGLQKIDAVRGRFDDMSGPLLFLGSSILRIQDLPDLNQNITSFKSFTSAQIIKIIIVLMFIAPLAALFIINLQRIFYLWLWIIFSPLIILMDDSIIKLGKFDIGKIKEKFSFKEILGLIFAPVLVIGGMSLVLIMSTGMYYVLGGEPGQNATQTQQTFSYGGADIINVAGKSTLSNPQQGSDITFEGDLFRDAASYAGGFVGYIIIVGFTIMLLWAIVKMSISSSEIAKGVYKLAETIVSSAPIVPVPGSKKGFSLGQIANTAGIGPNSQGFLKERGDELEQKFKTYTNKNGIKAAFLDTELGKGFKNKFGIDPEDFRDINKGQGGELSKKLSLADNMKSLGININDFVIDNPGAAFTSRSPIFNKAVKEAIDKNTKLKNAIMSKIGITDQKEFDSDLFKIDSKTGKRFFTLMGDLIRDKGVIKSNDNYYKDIKAGSTNETIELHAAETPAESPSTTPPAGTPPPTVN